MLLTKGAKVDVIHQVVVPMMGSRLNGRDRFQTGVRIQTSAPNDQWVLFVIPNPDNGDNAWQFQHKNYKISDFEIDAPSLEASMEPALYAPPKQALFASNTAELVRLRDWDHDNVSIKTIMDIYPDQYGFLVLQIDSPATEYAWKWRGNAPFAFTTTLENNGPAHHTIIMGNTKRMRWIDPEEPGPVRQVMTAKAGKPPAVAVTFSGHHAVPLDLVGEIPVPNRLTDPSNCNIM